MDHDFGGGLQGALTARAYRADFSLPYNGGPPGMGTGEDPNYTGADAQGALGMKLKYAGASTWEPSFNAGMNLVVRRYDNLPDAVNTDKIEERLRGRRFKFEQSNAFALSDSQTLVAGIDSQIETVDISQDYGFGPSTIDGESQAISGLFAEYRWQSSESFLTTAARADRFHGFSDQLTYRVGPGYRLATGTLLKASIGRGFKVPSLYQLYSSFGDRSLKPENSLSWDGGFAHEWKETQTRLSANYFQGTFRDLIHFNAAFKYENIQSASSRGVELTFSQAVGTLTLMTTYTYQRALNDQTGQLLARRPMHLLSQRISGQISDDLNFGFLLRYTGVRHDVDPAPPYAPIRMPSYFLVNADASYTLGRGYRAFGKLDNILNRMYEEVAGYGTAERSLYLGFQKEI